MLSLPSLRRLTLSLFHPRSSGDFYFSNERTLFAKKISRCALEIPPGADRAPGFRVVVPEAKGRSAVLSWVSQGARVGRFERLLLYTS